VVRSHHMPWLAPVQRLQRALIVLAGDRTHARIDARQLMLPWNACAIVLLRIAATCPAIALSRTCRYPG
jgi:predicted ATPase